MTKIGRRNWTCLLVCSCNMTPTQRYLPLNPAHRNYGKSSNWPWSRTVAVAATHLARAATYRCRGLPLPRLATGREKSKQGSRGGPYHLTCTTFHLRPLHTCAVLAIAQHSKPPHSALSNGWCEAVLRLFLKACAYQRQSLRRNGLWSPIPWPGDVCASQRLGVAQLLSVSKGIDPVDGGKLRI